MTVALHEDVPSPDPRRLSRMDVGAIALAFVAILAAAATWEVPVGDGVDGLRRVLISLSLTLLAGVLLRMTWRRVMPGLRKRAQKFLGISPQRPDDIEG
jgi:hypothetical protein